MFDADVLSSFAGGALIGLSASLLLLASGRVAGVSGIVGRLLVGAPGDRAWRAYFLAGLAIAGFFYAVLFPGSVTASPRPVAVVAVAGLLVGVGTTIGNGCTSGHGVCGLSRASKRSLAATLTFMTAGALTVAAFKLFGGGS